MWVQPLIIRDKKNSSMTRSCPRDTSHPDMKVTQMFIDVRQTCKNGSGFITKSWISWPVWFVSVGFKSSGQMKQTAERAGGRDVWLWGPQSSVSSSSVLVCLRTGSRPEAAERSILTDSLWSSLQKVALLHPLCHCQEDTESLYCVVCVWLCLIHKPEDALILPTSTSMFSFCFETLIPGEM